MDGHDPAIKTLGLVGVELRHEGALAALVQALGLKARHPFALAGVHAATGQRVFMLSVQVLAPPFPCAQRPPAHRHPAPVGPFAALFQIVGLAGDGGKDAVGGNPDRLATLGAVIPLGAWLARNGVLEGLICREATNPVAPRADGLDLQWFRVVAMIVGRGPRLTIGALNKLSLEVRQAAHLHGGLHRVLSPHPGRAIENDAKNAEGHLRGLPVNVGPQRLQRKAGLGGDEFASKFCAWLTMRDDALIEILRGGTNAPGEGLPSILVVVFPQRLEVHSAHRIIANCDPYSKRNMRPPVGSLDVYDSGMGTVRDHRRENFLFLLRGMEEQYGKHGAKRRFAEKAKMAPSLVSQIAQDFRQVGDEIARRIEQNFGLERGQMDLPGLGNFQEGPAVGVSKGVPIVGRAMLGQDGYFVEEEHPPGYGDGSVPHPTGDPNAYSLRVVGESMAPAILSGWLIVVEPSSAPVAGEYVHVLTKAGQHMIKKLLSLKRDSCSVVSVNGGAIATFQMGDLEYIRYVGGIYPPSKRRL